MEDSLFQDDNQLSWLDLHLMSSGSRLSIHLWSSGWEVNQKTAVWARSFYQQGTTIYDLGASLGAASWGTAQLCEGQPRIVAVEKSVAMVNRLRENLQASREIMEHNISVLQSDICEVDFEPSSVLICNYCLQFISPVKRRDLLQRIL